MPRRSHCFATGVNSACRRIHEILEGDVSSRLEKHIAREATVVLSSFRLRADQGANLGSHLLQHRFVHAPFANGATRPPVKAFHLIGVKRGLFMATLQLTQVYLERDHKKGLRAKAKANGTKSRGGGAPRGRPVSCRRLARGPISLTRAPAKRSDI